MENPGSACLNGWEYFISKALHCVHRLSQAQYCRWGSCVLELCGGICFGDHKEVIVIAVQNNLCSFSGIFIPVSYLLHLL